MGLLTTISALLFGCSPSNRSADTIAPISNDLEHNRYVKEANELIIPYMRIHGVPEKRTDSPTARAAINRGVALLQAVVAYNPTNWSSWWVMGKAYQALRENEKSCDSFAKAYAIQKDNPDVAREYMFACLEIGRNADGLAAAEHAISLSPNNAGLHANLALAYTVNGRIQDAQTEIRRSLQLDPSDEISLALNQIIQEIADGKRSPPHTLKELEGRK